MRELIRNIWLESGYNYNKAIEKIKLIDRDTNKTTSYNNVASEGGKDDDFITLCDEHYPQAFNDLQMPPLCIFYQGKLAHLTIPFKIGIIGSRTNSEYAHKVLKEIVEKLPKNLVIVSGLAKGIDGLAHFYAMENNIKTIGILGSGLKYQYPACNYALYQNMKNNELIISEYGYNEKIRKYHFIERNRLIAGLSDILIVIESAMRSGTHITVNEMLSLNKEVYVIPHEIYNKNGNGNNFLIQEGANIIYDIDEFCESLVKISKFYDK